MRDVLEDIRHRHDRPASSTAPCRETSFNDLPDTLLLHILQCLPPNSVDRHAFCLASATLYRITTGSHPTIAPSRDLLGHLQLLPIASPSSWHHGLHHEATNSTPTCLAVTSSNAAATRVEHHARRALSYVLHRSRAISEISLAPEGSFTSAIALPPTLTLLYLHRFVTPLAEGLREAQWTGRLHLGSFLDDLAFYGAPRTACGLPVYCRSLQRALTALHSLARCEGVELAQPLTHHPSAIIEEYGGTYYDLLVNQVLAPSSPPALVLTSSTRDQLELDPAFLSEFFPAIERLTLRYERTNSDEVNPLSDPTALEAALPNLRALTVEVRAVGAEVGPPVPYDRDPQGLFGFIDSVLLRFRGCEHLEELSLKVEAAIPLEQRGVAMSLPALRALKSLRHCAVDCRIGMEETCILPELLESGRQRPVSFQWDLSHLASLESFSFRAELLFNVELPADLVPHLAWEPAYLTGHVLNPTMDLTSEEAEALGKEIASEFGERTFARESRSFLSILEGISLPAVRRFPRAEQPEAVVQTVQGPEFLRGCEMAYIRQAKRGPMFKNMLTHKDEGWAPVRKAKVVVTKTFTAAQPPCDCSELDEEGSEVVIVLD